MAKPSAQLAVREQKAQEAANAQEEAKKANDQAAFRIDFYNKLLSKFKKGWQLPAEFDVTKSGDYAFEIKKGANGCTVTYTDDGAKFTLLSDNNPASKEAFKEAIDAYIQAYKDNSEDEPDEAIKGLMLDIYVDAEKEIVGFLKLVLNLEIKIDRILVMGPPPKTISDQAEIKNLMDMAKNAHPDLDKSKEVSSTTPLLDKQKGQQRNKTKPQTTPPLKRIQPARQAKVGR